MFEPKRERAMFCSNLCRATYHQNLKSQKNKAYKDGLKSVTHFVDENGNKIPFDKKLLQEIWDSLTKKNKEISIENVNPAEGETQSFDVLENSVYDFGDAKFLVVENFTKFRTQNAPVNKVDKIVWQKKKTAADQKIKDAWNEHLKNQKL